MIYITNIRNANPEKYDEIWGIVRSLKNKADYVKHVPELSPSWDLFKKYLALKEAGNWNQTTFDTIYRPQFMREMKAPEAQKALCELRDAGKEKDICIFCFCPTVNLCHRKLIGEILEYNGINVVYK